MEVTDLISDLGVPITMSIACMWGCYYLIRYITGQFSEMMINRFEEIRNIVIKLIDNSKRSEMKLTEIHAYLEAVLKQKQIEIETLKDNLYEKHVRNKK